MNACTRIFIFVLTVLSLGSVVAAAPSGVGPLTFSDEFDGTVLDLLKWDYRAPGPRFDAINTPLAVSVGDGMVTIKAFTETNPITGAKTHFGAQIATHVGRFEQQYGYFESRVRFHTTTGTSAAFWLQSPTIGQPIGDPENAGVEIDIFEHRFNDRANPANILNRVNNAAIWDGYGPEQQLRIKLSDPLPGLANDTWHTFGLLWTPEGYTYFYDDIPLWNGADAPISMRTQYIVLSMEIFAAFAGPLPPLGYGTLANTTTNVQFDYVRAYAIPEPAGLGVLMVALVTLTQRKRST